MARITSMDSTKAAKQLGAVFVAMFLLAGICLGQAAGSSSRSDARATTHVLTDWGEFHRSNMGRFSSVTGPTNTPHRGYATLLRFNGKNGGGPELGNLIFDAAGNLYGTTYSGGALGDGTVFELSPSRNGKRIHTILHAFSGKDGGGPNSPLVFDPAGNLYGTCTQQGAGNYGNVFKLAHRGNGKWTYTVLHTFRGGDGEYPYASVILDANGNLYGTTAYGGNRSLCDRLGCGTVFKLSPQGNGKWKCTILHAFTFTGEDGATPWAGLIFDAAGSLYGTTYEGGAYFTGTAYKLTEGKNGGWKQSLLHSFGDGDDASSPRSKLIFDASGNLYGTTYWGGRRSQGAIFRLTPGTDGQWTEKVLHSFINVFIGINPVAGLIIDSGGNLYGTTSRGGDYQACPGVGCGVAFKLVPDKNGEWPEVVLHTFRRIDGATPWGGLTFDTVGNLYGTTSQGDDLNVCEGSGCGGVFEIMP